jgi:hypothetical protein
MRSVWRVSELRHGLQFCGEKAGRGRYVSPLRPDPVVLRSIPRLDGRCAQSLDQVTANGRHRARSSTLPKTLVLIDSVRLTRECLGYFLRSRLPQFEIQSFSYANNALSCLKRRPAVVVVNLQSALIGDNAAKAAIADVIGATRCPSVLALLDKTETPAAHQVTEAGAAGVLPNDCSASLLVAAIHLLIEGRRFLAPSVSPPPMNQRCIQGRDSCPNTIFYETASEADRKRIINAPCARVGSF